MEKKPTEKIFSKDETKANWHKETDVEMLKKFCEEGYEQAKKHEHFIIGTTDSENFIGIPGRFMTSEQPKMGETGFTLWQPLMGGEELYSTLEEMTDEEIDTVYGYWIARLDSETLKISEV